MTSGSLWENVGFLNSSLIPVLMHSGGGNGTYTKDCHLCFQGFSGFVFVFCGCALRNRKIWARKIHKSYI